MTPIQLSEEHVRFYTWVRGQPFTLVEIEKARQTWLAAKQDSEQQRKELQERINYHAEY